MIYSHDYNIYMMIWIWYIRKRLFSTYLLSRIYKDNYYYMYNKISILIFEYPGMSDNVHRDHDLPLWVLMCWPFNYSYFDPRMQTKNNFVFQSWAETLKQHLESIKTINFWNILEKNNIYDMLFLFTLAS